MVYVQEKFEKFGRVVDIWVARQPPGPAAQEPCTRAQVLSLKMFEVLLKCACFPTQVRLCHHGRRERS